MLSIMWEPRGQKRKERSAHSTQRNTTGVLSSRVSPMSTPPPPRTAGLSHSKQDQRGGGLGDECSDLGQVPMYLYTDEGLHS